MREAKGEEMRRESFFLLASVDEYDENFDEYEEK